MKRAFLMLSLEALIFAFLVVAGCRKAAPNVNAETKARAQATLNQFFEHFHNPQPGEDGFSVKVPVDLWANKGKEYRWLTNLKLDEEPCSGTISSPPVDGAYAKPEGTLVTFTRQDIADWSFTVLGRDSVVVLGSELGTAPADK